MKIKNKLEDWIFLCFNGLLMLALAVVTIYPLLYVLFASLSQYGLLSMHRGLLLYPLGFSFASYTEVFKNPMIMNGYRNTLFILIVGTSLNLILTSLGAYVLSRKDVFWNKYIMFFIVVTMFVSGGMIPFYLQVKSLGLIDSVWALVLPVAMSTYNLIVMRSSFASIPESLIEAAKIEGANDFTVLMRIVLPLSKAILCVIMLFYGVSHWNAWFNAAMFMRDRAKFPLQLVLREILINSDTSRMSAAYSGLDKESVGQTLKYATIIIATLPILCAYPFIQKYFTAGVMVGAVKG